MPPPAPAGEPPGSRSATDPRRPAAAIALTLLSLLAGASLLTDASVAGPAFALAAAGLPMALIALAVRRDRPGAGLGLALAGLLVLLVGGLGALVALRGRVEELPWPGGVPLVAAILLGGLWLLPLLLTTALYAATFDRHGLATADLERLRRGRGAVRDDPATRGDSPAGEARREPLDPSGRGAP